MNNWLIFSITILLSAFFSGMEIAFFSSNKLRIEIEKQKGLLSGKIFSRFLVKPSSLIATLLIGNNIALVLYGMVAAILLQPLITLLFPFTLHSDGLLLVIQTVCATLVILVFAEFLPKVIFRIHPNGVLHLFAVPTILFHYLFKILIAFIEFLWCRIDE